MPQMHALVSLTPLLPQLNLPKWTILMSALKVYKYFEFLLDFENYHVEYNALSFIVHNRTYFSFYDIHCNKEIQEGYMYDLL